MDGMQLAETPLVGWRGRVADQLAEPVADKTKLSSEQVRAILGVAFFAVSVYYVAATVLRAVKSG